MTTDLEGAYLAGRIDRKTNSVELITDYLGVHQAYYWRSKDGWLISNNIQLLRAAAGRPCAWDDLGVSLFLGLGWTGADRTLHTEIRVIPGGQHWRWAAGQSDPACQTYFSMATLAGHLGEGLSAARLDDIAGRMSDACGRLSGALGELQCPLTGGRDSRLVAAAVVKSGAPATYYTGGDPNSPDMIIARQLSEVWNVSHRAKSIDASLMLHKWDQTARRLVQQNDGLVSLWQIVDILDQPDEVDPLPVELWGMGGEVGRGYFGHPGFYLPGRKLSDAQQLIFNYLVGTRAPFLTATVVENVRAYLKEFSEQAVGCGFAPLDVPDVFFLFDLLRRWSGSNARKSAPTRDLFAPISIRPFVEGVFSLNAAQRYTEPLHYQLLKRLAPEVFDLPFVQGPWRSQSPARNASRWLYIQMVHTIRTIIRRPYRPPAAPPRTFDRVTWLEARLPELRAVCLDQSSSPLWQYVDRASFERLTSQEQAQETVSKNTESVYDIATLFSYADMVSSPAQSEIGIQELSR